MAKRVYQRVNNAIEGWDALVNDNYTQMEDQPFPLADYASFAGLPAAASNDEAIAIYDDTSATDKKVAVSNGVAWFRLPLMATTVADLSAPIVIAGTGDDADINTNFSSIQAKINALLAVMRVAKSLAP